ncbi:DivIVA domain-containing protein [Corynebacterium hylobatis]|uniref:DivIVA domain-containing protein n=2 Tax=Corynebacterium TaxID=1716 RepID=A0A430I0W3_9CORY|nr:MULTISPECIES: DivIVA domain-containing protein [Corynebacterium]MCS5478888.1 DivIVA domain-containing protein [Corynebacterium lemuris]RSZ65479.1 DivIVA domain-containing protein [Corynebacterium hylobatis]
MFSWLLLIIVLLALIAVGIWFWGAVFGRGEVLPPLDADNTRDRNEQAVAAGDLNSVQFEIVHRGYRPEQVDDVLDQLHRRLAEAEKTITRLSSPKID